MAKIKVKRGGCGIVYTDANGKARHALKTPESGPFECDDAQAARLVELGVAEYVGAPAAEPAPQPDAQSEDVEATDEETGEPAQETERKPGHIVAAELERWDYNDLKKLAADMGVTPSGKKKSDYIAALVAADVEIDTDEDDEDELPDLSVADPE